MKTLVLVLISLASISSFAGITDIVAFHLFDGQIIHVIDDNSNFKTSSIVGVEVAVKKDLSKTVIIPTEIYKSLLEEQLNSENFLQDSRSMMLMKTVRGGDGSGGG